ncbi:hypothetical protein CXG81DRAFT_17426 [Caulochytrium protostelioides]|uniref:Nucleolus and neural progenitor protein-like N-terminal domain-containing protein n=1 Tax=Caulochytrium protostelioides TaxID=1555241 RepID=A0A4P9XC43_9FUNG|nr:hypothetical protein CAUPRSCDRAFT_11545 [Caulochytrium protostelioides]RKP02985.1 hypothetical protein CXG81DRAFT_17426 [Caulochytrium protostelioides]|eukprot:RKP02985.1 hypothetical protein CXG81DRAFT_17426 [Caulochytrium protostelioides]
MASKSKSRPARPASASSGPPQRPPAAPRALKAGALFRFPLPSQPLVLVDRFHSSAVPHGPFMAATSTLAQHLSGFQHHQWLVDMATLGRLRYRNKVQQRTSRHFRQLAAVMRQLKRFEQLQLGKLLNDVLTQCRGTASVSRAGAAAHPSHGSTNAYRGTGIDDRMPTAPTLGYLLAAAWQSWCITQCLNTEILAAFALFQHQLQQTYFMPLSLTAMALLGSLASYAGQSGKRLEQWYTALYPHLAMDVASAWGLREPSHMFLVEDGVPAPLVESKSTAPAAQRLQLDFGLSDAEDDETTGFDNGKHAGLRDVANSSSEQLASTFASSALDSIREAAMPLQPHLADLADANDASDAFWSLGDPPALPTAASTTPNALSAVAASSAVRASKTAVTTVKATAITATTTTVTQRSKTAASRSDASLETPDPVSAAARGTKRRVKDPERRSSKSTKKAKRDLIDDIFG